MHMKNGARAKLCERSSRSEEHEPPSDGLLLVVLRRTCGSSEVKTMT